MARNSSGKGNRRKGGQWKGGQSQTNGPGPGFGGTMRASQAVSTYGAGALMDLLDEAVLIAGLDFWHYEDNDKHNDGFIAEPRLRDVVASLKEFSDKQVMAAVERIRRDEVPAQQPVRTAELKQLAQSAPERTGDLPAPRQDFFARSWPVPRVLAPLVSKLVLVHRLREVRAQVGFTRLEAPTADLQGEFDLGVTSACLGLHADWVPATEVRGEGIFLQLAEGAVAAWERRPAVVEREQALKAGFAAWRRQRAAALGVSVEELPHLPFPRARFYMLHSLSHLLMNALSLECGYSASALSERIYCASPQNAADDAHDSPMAGILISTGTTGAEGTLGGLVEQGHELEHHLRRAVELGQLCSHDPVCDTPSTTALRSSPPCTTT